MALLSKILDVFAVLLLAVMLAAAFDVFHIGLADMLTPLAIVPIALFFVISIAVLFLPTGNAANDVPEDTDLAKKMEELQSKTNSRLTDMQTTLDAMTGQDKDALLEENSMLKGQLEAIQQAERDKVLAEAETLRSRNEDLENQIKQWAVQTVGESLVDGKSPQNEAA